MRIKEIINEINMSPTRLAKSAAMTNAMVGIEFEMCVPGVDPHAGTIEYENTPDFDEDVNVTSFGSIYSFFMKNGANYRSVINNVVNDLEEDFYEWKDESVRKKWEDEKVEYIKQQLSNEEYFAPDTTDDEIDNIVNNFEEYDKDTYGELKDQFIDEKEDEFNSHKWFEETGLTMKEIFDNNDLEWPYQNEEEIIIDSEYPYDEYDMDQLGETLSQMIGKEVNVGYKYHGATRRDGEYSLEPDGSVEDPTDSSLAGLEFIAPAMPLHEMVTDLAKIVKWAKKYGCKTNETTGLHMNVSIPNTTGDNLDYVKLALLLGDNYILETFGRWGNIYCKPVLNNIQKKIQNKPEIAMSVLEQLKANAMQKASELVHAKFTEKKVSINIKDEGSYIEIRSPGGDWLNTDLSTLIDTLNRIAVAIDAAYDPTKYRKEYLKKFYKLIIPNEKNDAIDLFNQFSTGTITAEQLKQRWGLLMSKIQPSTRQTGMFTKINALHWWNVKSSASPFNALVKGYTRSEVINDAKRYWIQLTTGELTVTKLEKCDLIPEDNTVKLWTVISYDNTFKVDNISAVDENIAMKRAISSNPGKFNSGFSAVYLTSQ